MKKQNTNKGITLIALVITIIVMLILVGVTISMAVNGGLFEYAGRAASETNRAMANEKELANLDVDMTVDEMIEKYTGGSEDTLPTYTNASKADGYLTEKATYTDGVEEKPAIIPKGYKIVNEGEKIANGIVIADSNGNEFVWIPVEEDLGSSYSYSSDYSEPEEITDTWYWSSLETKPKYDSQEILDELYGANYYTYSEDFKYAEEYAQMVEKVNEYNGFYIGRYETTIDSDGKIGSKYNTPVLTGGTTLFTKDETDYPYRWHGLYQAGKNANVSGNGTDVQTAMIYGVLYDEAMQFIRDQKAAGNTTYDVDTNTASWHHGSAVVNSGQLNPGEAGDVALNIWDLESNAFEWTQEAYYPEYRSFRGGGYRSDDVYEASYRDGCNPLNVTTHFSARLALYLQ